MRRRGPDEPCRLVVGDVSPILLDLGSDDLHPIEWIEREYVLVLRPLEYLTRDREVLVLRERRQGLLGCFTRLFR